MLGSSSLSTFASTDVAEVSLVRTLLRSVPAVPGTLDAVNWDLKLERSSSPPSQGGAPPVTDPDPELSARLLKPKGGLVAVTGGGPGAFLTRPEPRTSGKSAEVGDKPVDAHVEDDILEDADGRRGRCHGLGGGAWLSII